MLKAIELPRVETWDVREYLRLSKDMGGSSIKRQAWRNAQAREVRGWGAGPRYDADGDRSASPYRTREREDFDRLLEDLVTGRFGAKILQAYETSRLTRESDQAGGIIRACRAAKVKIFITSSNRLYDMDNASDRRDLRDAASRDEFSSDETSMRTADTAAMEAEMGRPNGIAPYGLKPVYDPRTGKLINWFADDTPGRIGALGSMCKSCGMRVGSRTHMVCTLFAELEKGSSLKRMQRDFEASGYVNKSGGTFGAEHLRRVALRSSYAGIRTHKGAEYKAAWDGIVPMERFLVVRKMLTNPARTTNRSGGAKHEFTGALGCGDCRGRIIVRKAGASYNCRISHVQVSKDEVDELLTNRLLGYLSRPDVYTILTARSGSDEQVAKTRGALAQARTEKAEMDAETPKTLAEVRVLARAVAAKEEEIATLESREREMTLPPALAALLSARGGVKDSWFKAPVEACREIVRHVMVPEFLGRPLIMRTTEGVFTPPAGRIRWEKS